jgi:hypothetical protein
LWWFCPFSTETTTSGIIYFPIFAGNYQKAERIPKSIVVVFAENAQKHHKRDNVFSKTEKSKKHNNSDCGGFGLFRPKTPQEEKINARESDKSAGA